MNKVPVGKQHERVARVLDYIVNAFDAPATLKEMAGVCCRSVPAFCNFLKRETGGTLTGILNRFRVNHAFMLLKVTYRGMREVCCSCGFSTVANFHKQFKKAFGCRPCSTAGNCAVHWALAIEGMVKGC